MLLNVGQISAIGLAYTIVVTSSDFYRLVDFNKICEKKFYRYGV
jgi:hypothetical protein